MWHQHWRSGVNGGNERYGNSGGSERTWYNAYFKAKGYGKGVAKTFLEEFGHPKERTFTEGKRAALMASRWVTRR